MTEILVPVGNTKKTIKLYHKFNLLYKVLGCSYKIVFNNLLLQYFAYILDSSVFSSVPLIRIKTSLVEFTNKICVYLPIGNNFFRH